MKKLFLSVFAVVALVALVPSQAFNMELDYRLSGTAPESDVTPWLEATFEDVELNRVRLKLENTNLTESESVSEWYFNFNPTKNLSQLRVTPDSDNADVLSADPSIDKGSNAYQVPEAGSFDIKFEFSGFTGREEVLFDLTMDGGGVVVTAADFDFLSSSPDEAHRGSYQRLMSKA